MYVRQALRMTQSPPLFVLLDTKRPRLDLLQQYADAGALPGAIALGGREAVDKQLLALPEGERPPGLRQWDEWGAPKGSPGECAVAAARPRCGSRDRRRGGHTGATATEGWTASLRSAL